MKLRMMFKRRKDILITGAVMVIVSALLNMSFLFSNSDKIESTLMQQIPLDYETYNDHKFVNNENSDSFCKEELITFFDDVSSLSNKDEVESFNCNIIMKVGGFGPDMRISGQFDIHSIDAFGINSVDFSDRQLLNITAGRMFDQNELSNGDKKVIISNYLIGSDEENHINIGDFIEVYPYEIYPLKDSNGNVVVQQDGLYTLTMNKGNAIRLEVIGFYEPKIKYALELTDDMFINENYILMPNTLLENMIRSMTFNGLSDKENIARQSCSDNVRINRVSFRVKDFNGMKSFKEGFDGLCNKYNLHSKQMNYEKLLDSLKLIRSVYSYILLITSSIATIIMICIVWFKERKEKNNTNLLYVLGDSKPRIIYLKILKYLIISIPAQIIGAIVSVLIANGLMNRIIDKNLIIQSELLRYANYGVEYKNLTEIHIEKMNSVEIMRSVATTTVMITSVLVLFLIPLMLFQITTNSKNDV